MVEQRFPPGWDLKRVQELIAHYDALSEAELVAEDEAAIDQPAGETVIAVPDSLLPAIRQLLADTPSDPAPGA